MKVFHSISEFTCGKRTVVTLGSFDGVHIGHQKIIDRLINSAVQNNLESVILTFSQHPKSFLEADNSIRLLNSNEEKISLLKKTKLDNLIIHPFDTSFAKLSGEEFVKNILVDKFHVKKIIIGYDHRFGKNRTANIDDLIIFGEKYGFEVEQISAQEINDVSVSSTKIRTALAEGNITLANDYLGYDYFLTGRVIKGKQLGRTIGFPTANIKINDEQKLIPQNGVYIIRSIFNNNTVFGMMNIGTNPTVNGEKQSIEVHFFNFYSNLYDREIVVSILHRLRSEQKFESVEKLKQQLESDEINSLSYIKNLQNNKSSF